MFCMGQLGGIKSVVQNLSVRFHEVIQIKLYQEFY